MDLSRLPIDLVEILNKITPNEEEQKKFQKFSKDKKNPKNLADNDRFLYEVSNYVVPPTHSKEKSMDVHIYMYVTCPLVSSIIREILPGKNCTNFATCHW